MYDSVKGRLHDHHFSNGVASRLSDDRERENVTGRAGAANACNAGMRCVLRGPGEGGVRKIERRLQKSCGSSHNWRVFKRHEL